MFVDVHHIGSVVSDMKDALGVFRDTFELDLDDRRVIEGLINFRAARMRFLKSSSSISSQPESTSPKWY